MPQIDKFKFPVACCAAVCVDLHASMESDPRPAFEVPLADDELVMLGRIAAVFSQIDELLTWLICSVHGIAYEQYDLFLGSRMLSTRVDALREGLDRVSDAQAVAAASAFIEEIKRIIPERNLAMHGCWGRFTRDYENYRVGPYSRSKPNQRLFADQLPALYEKACKASRLLVTALARFGVLSEPDPDAAAHIIWTHVDRPPDRGYHTKGSVAFRV